MDRPLDELFSMRVNSTTFILPNYGGAGMPGGANRRSRRQPGRDEPGLPESIPEKSLLRALGIERLA
jgi:hypothetical protein